MTIKYRMATDVQVFCCGVYMEYFACVLLGEQVIMGLIIKNNSNGRNYVIHINVFLLVTV